MLSLDPEDYEALGYGQQIDSIAYDKWAAYRARPRDEDTKFLDRVRAKRNYYADLERSRARASEAMRRSREKEEVRQRDIERNKKWLAENKEKRRETQKRWYAKWIESNREKRRENNRRADARRRAKREQGRA